MNTRRVKQLNEMLNEAKLTNRDIEGPFDTIGYVIDDLIATLDKARNHSTAHEVAKIGAQAKQMVKKIEKDINDVIRDFER